MSHTSVFKQYLIVLSFSGSGETPVQLITKFLFVTSSSQVCPLLDGSLPGHPSWWSTGQAVLVWPSLPQGDGETPVPTHPPRQESTASLQLPYSFFQLQLHEALTDCLSVLLERQDLNHLDMDNAA